MADCRYLVAADNYTTGATLDRVEPARSPRQLCAWAHYHPDAVQALASAPPWVAKDALAGDRWRPGQCDRCPCFQPGAPVEIARAAA